MAKKPVISTQRTPSNHISRIAPSKEMSAQEKKIWETIVDSLPSDHFCEADRIALETYIRAFCYAAKCRAMIDSQGDVLIDDKSGRAYKSPWVSILNSQQTVINLLAPKLRVTPSGRVSNSTTRVLYNTGEDDESKTPERDIVR